MTGSPKAASEFLTRAGIDGVKYPVASYMRGVKDGDKAGWNYVSFRDDNIRVDHKWEDGNLRYLRDRGTGTVLGIFDRDTGKLKLFRGANWKTLNHELGGHATMRLAEQEAERGNRALLDKINEAIDGAMKTPLADDVRRRYPDADEATLRDEIWAALRERPSEAMRKYVATLQGRKWYNRAWDAIKTAWRGVLSRMGFNRADLSGIDKMTPDEFNEFLDKAEEADGFVFGASVHYAGPNGNMKSFMDRVFYAGSNSFRLKPGACVAACRRAGVVTTMGDLNKYLTISEMPVVSSTYWNMVFGFTAEEAKQDAEGMRTMRNIGHNMAYLLKCMEAAEKAGVERPAGEPGVWTHFIGNGTVSKR